MKPSVLQNRFCRQVGYDAELREHCAERGVRYQSFWTLSGNPEALESRQVARVAARLGCTREQAWFAFTIALGITPLTGTTSAAHMQDDLAATQLEITDHESRQLQQLLRPPSSSWF